MICILIYDNLTVVNTVGAIGIELSEPNNSIKRSI